MLGLSDERAASTWLVVLVLALPVLAGCLGPNLPQAPEGFDTILVETTYDGSARRDQHQRSQDRALDLPSGYPAANMTIELTIRPAPGYEGDTWPYDEPCPNREGPHGTYADCEGFDRMDAYILPSPNDAEDYEVVNYPLDADGTALFHIPEPIGLGGGTNDPYTDRLYDDAEDPDRCERWPRAFTHDIALEGAFEEDGRPGWVIRGDVRYEVLWYGICPDRGTS